VRGRRNEPAYLVHTVDELAVARDTSREELEAIVDANADQLFGLG
jgi:Tat protein secretion system quality control protein TatD with DNase activity